MYLQISIDWLTSFPNYQTNLVSLSDLVTQLHVN